MKKVIFLLFLCLPITILWAQQSSPPDSSFILSVNQQIDNYVVQQNIVDLTKLYADDFVFSHGSGKIEGKQSWFKSVAKGGFIQRKHDSVTVELHKHLAIVRGKLSVQKKGVDKPSRYHLKYVRVYAYRNKQWQMISHITVSEYHEPV